MKTKQLYIVFEEITAFEVDCILAASRNWGQGSTRQASIRGWTRAVTESPQASGLTPRSLWIANVHEDVPSDECLTQPQRRAGTG